MSLEETLLEWGECISDSILQENMNFYLDKPKEENENLKAENNDLKFGDNNMLRNQLEHLIIKAR